MQIIGTVYHRMLCDLLSDVEKHETTVAHFDPVENLMSGCKNNVIFLWLELNHQANEICPWFKIRGKFQNMSGLA